MENILTILSEYWEIVSAIVVVASLIANKTKTDKDNKAVGIISKLVNSLALNLDKLKK